MIIMDKRDVTAVIFIGYLSLLKMSHQTANRVRSAISSEIFSERTEMAAL